MKSMSQWTRNSAWLAMILASASLSYGMPNHHKTRKGTHLGFQLMVPQKSQNVDWYQPPRSPGYNEEFGS
jgi:hypothetical protein